MEYEIVIGLETHIQLATASKIFCADDATFGGAPNTHTSAISLAHPGTLPRLNKKAVEYAIQLGLALACEINPLTAFDRKNYFYADLPKGYQVTQDKHPICLQGVVCLQGKGQPRNIRLHHIHLEEDAGKSTHDQDPHDSLIDLNRAGVPLLEIVSEPDLRSGDEVAEYMENLRRLVRWLGISDGNMEEGSLRCDVNISVRKKGSSTFGNRCEIKNMNSMRFAKRAIEFESKRQIEILEKGGKIDQETRGFDPANGTTFSLREKENAHDYRYFPEPDLTPVLISRDMIESIKAQMPLLPDALQQTFKETYGLPAQDAEQLSQERETAFHFWGAAQKTPENLIKPLANLIINRILPWATNEGKSINDFPLTLEQVHEYLTLIDSGKISASTATQRLFPALMEHPQTAPSQLAATLNLLQSSDSDFLEQIVDEVIAKNPTEVEAFKKGKKNLIGFFMGEVMKASKGKADPKATTQILNKKLSK